MTTRRTIARPGFTLLELIVACAMMTVLVGSLYASLQIGFRARRSALRAMEPCDAMRLAMERIVSDLHAAMPPTGVFAGPFNVADDPTAGVGNQTLSFYAAAEAAAPGGGDDFYRFAARGDVQQVYYAVQTSPDGQHRQLVRQLVRNPLAQGVLPEDPQVVCDDVVNFQVRCFDGLLWMPSWDSTAVDNVLPVAVEITLELAPRTGGPTRNYRLVRVVGMPCSKPVDNSELIPGF